MRPDKGLELCMDRIVMNVVCQRTGMLGISSSQRPTFGGDAAGAGARETIEVCAVPSLTVTVCQVSESHYE